MTGWKEQKKKHSKPGREINKQPYTKFNGKTKHPDGCLPPGVQLPLLFLSKQILKNQQRITYAKSHVEKSL